MDFGAWFGKINIFISSRTGGAWLIQGGAGVLQGGFAFLGWNGGIWGRSKEILIDPFFFKLKMFSIN